MSIGVTDWHMICLKCKYESANLIPKINSLKKNRFINEDAREIGLKYLRKKNFSLLLAQIKKFKFNRARLLDVGCGHGWFLEIAKSEFVVKGIEPDINIFKTTKDRIDIDVINGYFPGPLKVNEKFDLIIFNDVFEHIRHSNKLMNSIKSHLNPEGLLIINLPSSTGFFYRTSKILFFYGFESFFERMWQKDLPSPHLHYFNHNNLIIFLKKHGFKTIHMGNLPSLSLRGLFSRIQYSKKTNFIYRAFVFFAILISTPFVPFLPKDIFYIVASLKD